MCCRKPLVMAVGISACLVAFAGCSSTYDATVAGTVTLNGELADRGTVAFHPVKGGPIAHGLIDEDGNYTVRVGAGDDPETGRGSLPSGEYVVTVVVSQPPKESEGGGPPPPVHRLSAPEFADAKQSPLRKTVEPGPNFVLLTVDAAADYEEQLASIQESQNRSPGTPEPSGEDDGEAADEGEASDDKGLPETTTNSESRAPSTDEGESPPADEPTPEDGGDGTT